MHRFQLFLANVTHEEWLLLAYLILLAMRGVDIYHLRLIAERWPHDLANPH